MAFLRYANATLKNPSIASDAWDALRMKALVPAIDFGKRTAKVLLQEYHPDKYLLSHCTIIASVDTEGAENMPLGKHMVDGFEVDRRFPDFYVTPQTSQYINNNKDAWERKLLLGCFRTFVGGENYVEHIQIPELSKGKILDAAARNLGDTVYVDILVATDRKHNALIHAITTGQIGTLSMGCSVDYTICTRCGNVAEDEVHICPCIKHFKGMDFVDALGRTRKIAELCGHHTDPASVKFIEASWVANPAFEGAVLRNIITPSKAEIESLGKRMQVAFSEAPRTAVPGMIQKSAHGFAVAQDQSQGVGGGGEGQGGGAAPKNEDSITKVVDDLVKNVRDRVVERVRGEIDKGEAGKVREVLDENRENESLIKSALQRPEWQRIAKTVEAMAGKGERARKILLGLILHKNGGWKALRAARTFTGRDILATSRVLDSLTKRSSIAGEARVYRTVIAVGGTVPYPDVETYLSACRQILGRALTGSEAAALLEKGRLYALGS